MSRDSDTPIPPALRDRLQAEDAEEQADLEAVWRLLEDANPLPDDAPALDGEWAALRRRRPEVASESGDILDAPSLDGDPAASPPGESPGRSQTRYDRRPVRADRSRRPARWAGAITVVVIVILAVAWVWRQPVTITAGPGDHRTETLPDGSTAELNSGTSLTYRRGFQAWPFVAAEQRSVHLDGEAFFAVEEDRRPFVVETASAEVRVPGTRFNVRARSAVDSTTTVTVADGQVEVRARARPDRSVTLDDRGETSRVKSRTATPTAPQSGELDPVLAWRQNGFAVTEEPLARVVQELERRYDTALHIHESVGRRQAPLTLYYPKSVPLPTILRDVCTALDLNYRPLSRGYELFAPPNGR